MVEDMVADRQDDVEIGTCEVGNKRVEGFTMGEDPQPRSHQVLAGEKGALSQRTGDINSERTYRKIERPSAPWPPIRI